MGKYNVKFLVFVLVFIVFPTTIAAQPVFRNPNISDSESFEITDYIDKTIGFVTAKVNISLKERNGSKYYLISVNEGNYFFDEIEVNYDDLTTISEKRVDLRTNSIVEHFINPGNNSIYFFNKENKLDKNLQTRDNNIYSRYAYFFSLRGFPFAVGKSVTFKTYIAEYGDALTMKVTNVAKQMVSVKAGTFECYKLELSVAGWQSMFASDKFYFYFSVTSPHQFVKYEEKENDARWNCNELIKAN